MNNWIVFLAGVVAFTIVYAVLMYTFSFNGYEKDIFRGPIIKILKKIGLRQ